jgi:acyl-CoA thioester hydrolase
MAFAHQLRVRYGECDPQGIVFNANYLTYVDIAITELWRALFGSYQAFVETTGVDIVVADVQLRFRGSARFDDQVTVTLTPALTSASSITTALSIDRGDVVLVQGSIRHVCVDAHELVKVPAPGPLREALAVPTIG